MDTLKGRIRDCDAHLYLQPDVMTQILGDMGGDWLLDSLQQLRASERYVNERATARQRLWETKGLVAFGACEADERLSAMDDMGIATQLLFPNTMGRETRAVGSPALAAVRRYNDYAVAWTEATGARGRAVCELNMRSVDDALAEARRVVDAGAKGLLLSCAYPPGGTSPANDVWDPLWDLLQEADVPAFLHIGSGGTISAPDDDALFIPREWADAAGLKSAFPDRPGSEERIGPFWVVIASQAPELFLTTMVMGGIFERFPRLRFGVIEFGAQWTGPWVERMETHANLLAKVGAALPLKPSEYVGRNIRVTPFWAEPVDRYVDRYGLEEIYVFSTDYPHVEGGKDPIGKFMNTVGPLGETMVEEFFVHNADLLFPKA